MTGDAHQPLRAVFLTALSLETKAILLHLTEIEEVRRRGTIFIRGRFQAGPTTWTIYVAELGAGNSSAAVIGERAFFEFQPHVALFVGVAGGVKDVAIGDVVAGEKIYGYEAGKEWDHGFKPRSIAPIASYSLVQTARAVLRSATWIDRIRPDFGYKPTAFVGAIAAGEKVVSGTRSPTARFLREYYGDTLAVEMEGRGFMAALHVNPEIHGMVIRGISDLLSRKTMADAAGSQLKASSAASAFAFALIARHADAISDPAPQHSTADESGATLHPTAVGHQALGTSVTAFGTDSNDPDDLIGSDVWKCYETLFPIKEERDDPIDIIAWLREGYAKSTDWAEVFFTLSDDNICIGMAYVSLLKPLDGGDNRPKGWCFGNYFGIKKGWRDSGSAIRFLEAITEKCENIMPNSKGIVFEVERYNNAHLRSAFSKLEKSVELTDEEKHDIRAARRIALYTAKGFRSSRKSENNMGSMRALPLVTKSKSEDAFHFVDFVQPAMGNPIEPHDEIDLWLMVFPMQGLQIEARQKTPHELTQEQISELIEFIYDELYPSAYSREYSGGESRDTAIPGFDRYVKEVRRRVQQSIEGKQVYLGMDEILSREARRVLLYHNLDYRGLDV